MANSNGGIELNLRVNTETGQLEVLGTKFSKAAEGAKQAETSFKGLAGEAKNLLETFIPLFTAVEVVKFFSDAVKGAEEQNEAMRRLSFTLDSTGQKWKDGGAAVKQWADAIASATRFSDGEALQTLDKLTRATGNLTQAQSASKLAMDLSVATGKSLGETTELVNGLINKNQRSVMEAHREYGTFTEKAQTAQEVLDALQAKVSGASDKEDSLTKSSHQLGSAFGQFKDVVGNSFAPAIAAIINGLTSVVKRFDEFGTVVATFVLVVAERFRGLGEAIELALRGHFEAARNALSASTAEIKNIILAGVEEVRQSEAQKSQIVNAGATERINATTRMSDAELQQYQEMIQKESDEDTARFQHWAQIREQEKQKAIQIETQIEQAILTTGDQTLKKKQQLLEQEYAYKRTVINKEIHDEQTKHNLLVKLEQERVVENAALIKADNLTRLNAALETVDLATQTLSIVNSLGDQNSKAEVNRAKAILALEKAIAIARAISAAMAAPPGIAQAIAAAQIALITAQFAQQMRSIDQAQAQFKSNQSSVSTPSLSLDSGGATLPSIGAAGVSSGPALSGGGGGASVSGGGGQTIINVGGVVVNFDTDKLSVDNVDAVMEKLYEKVRQGTIEGVQLAVALSQVAARNSQLAVG